MATAFSRYWASALVGQGVPYVKPPAQAVGRKLGSRYVSVGLSCWRCQVPSALKSVKPARPTSTRCTYSTSAALNVQSAFVSPQTCTEGEQVPSRRLADRAGCSSLRPKEAPPFRATRPAPAVISKGAAPAPFEEVINTATEPPMEDSVARGDTTVRITVATCTYPEAAVLAALPTISISEAGLPVVHANRYCDHAGPEVHPVAANRVGSTVTVIWKLSKESAPTLMYTGTLRLWPKFVGGNGTPACAPKSTSSFCAMRLP